MTHEKRIRIWERYAEICHDRAGRYWAIDDLENFGYWDGKSELAYVEVDRLRNGKWERQYEPHFTIREGITVTLKLESPPTVSATKPFLICEWIDVQNLLPNDGDMVLGYRPNSRAHDYANRRRIMEIVVFEKLPFPNFSGTKENAKEETGNNLFPYQWHGCFTYFGQDVTHWMPLPGIPSKLKGK